MTKPFFSPFITPINVFPSAANPIGEPMGSRNMPSRAITPDGNSGEFLSGTIAGGCAATRRLKTIVQDATATNKTHVFVFTLIPPRGRLHDSAHLVFHSGHVFSYTLDTWTPGSPSILSKRSTNSKARGHFCMTSSAAAYWPLARASDIPVCPATLDCSLMAGSPRQFAILI